MCEFGPKLMLEVGLRHDGKHTRSANIFIPHWEMDKTSSFDTSITSTLHTNTVRSGCSAALAVDP